ncbi:uncharacterized protein TNCV_2784841 [Trichonephila clavipes]|nr:uncharacterized protein TNCV_2784841 [Trichonephila clavipes]
MALSVKQFLTSKNIAVIMHPPYSPDLVPCDSFIFLTVKSCLKRTHFTSVEVVQAKNGESPENPFKDLVPQDCYQQWQHLMQKWENAEGDYFEGHNVTEN